MESGGGGKDPETRELRFPAGYRARFGEGKRGGGSTRWARRGLGHGAGVPRLGLGSPAQT